MAGALQYLTKAEVTQQFYNSYNSTTGNVTNPIPAYWAYNASANGSNDAAAVTNAVGYYNFAIGYLKVGDVIWQITSDGTYHLRYVSVNDGTNITTVQVA